MKNIHKIQLTGTIVVVHETEVGNGSRTIVKPFEGIEELSSLLPKGKGMEAETLSKTNWTRVVRSQIFDFNAFVAYAADVVIEKDKQAKKWKPATQQARAQKLAFQMWSEGDFKPVMKHWLESFSSNSSIKVSFKTSEGDEDLHFIENKIGPKWSSLYLAKTI